eukprot:scaffold28980_cov50-Phaeocystis_antarctica.AAC.2
MSARSRRCCGANAVQHADGGEPLEQIGWYRLRGRACGERCHQVTCFTPLVANAGEIIKEQGRSQTGGDSGS